MKDVHRMPTVPTGFIAGVAASHLKHAEGKSQTAEFCCCDPGEGR